MYSVACQSCQSTGSLYRKVDERNNLPPCLICGGRLGRVIEAPMVALFPRYDSPLDGRPITSRRERAADLQRAKAYEWEPGIEKDIARKKQYNIEASNAEIGKAVDSIVRDLNNCGKLENLDAS